MGARRLLPEGVALYAVMAGTLVLLCVWLGAMRQFDVDGVRMVIRFTARASLLLFCLAFSAGALARLRPNGTSLWLRRNRRIFGLCFATSHGLHAMAIGAFALMDPVTFHQATSAASYVFGGLGYAAIIAMTVTSFDRTRSAMTLTAWRRLHLICGYYLLAQFAISFGMRIPAMPLYALFLLPLALTMAVRLFAMAVGSRTTPAQAP